MSYLVLFQEKQHNYLPAQNIPSIRQPALPTRVASVHKADKAGLELALSEILDGFSAYLIPIPERIAHAEVLINICCEQVSSGKARRVR